MRTTDARRLWLVPLMVLCLGLTPGAQAVASEWQPGPEAIFDNTYTGAVDSPVGGSTVSSSQAVVVSGWVVDRMAEGWAGIDDVHVYDGLAGPGGTFLGRAIFAQSRPDVAQALANPFWTNSGFVLSVAAGTLGAGAHTLTIYAHTPAKGWWSTQVSFTIAPPAVAPLPVAGAAGPVNVILQPRGITISKAAGDHYSIKGYALDPNATRDTGIDHIDLYMDELRGQSDSKFIGRADMGHNQPEAADKYGPRFMPAGYQIDFKPGDFDVGNHHIYAYAVSSITGQETLDTAGFNIAK